MVTRTKATAPENVPPVISQLSSSSSSSDAPVIVEPVATKKSTRKITKSKVILEREEGKAVSVAQLSAKDVVSVVVKNKRKKIEVNVEENSAEEDEINETPKEAAEIEATVESDIVLCHELVELRAQVEKLELEAKAAKVLHSKDLADKKYYTEKMSENNKKAFIYQKLFPPGSMDNLISNPKVFCDCCK
jgi:hypothetical protein